MLLTFYKNNLNFIPLYFLAILLGTIKFVFGQYFLKHALIKQNAFLETWIVFTFTMGIVGLLIYILLNYIEINNKEKILNFKNKDMILNAIYAGIVFAFGNLFWIYSISANESLGGIRVIMAGIETFLLFLLGYLLFSEKFTFIKLIGILFILLGIYIVV